MKRCAFNVNELQYERDKEEGSESVGLPPQSSGEGDLYRNEILQPTAGQPYAALEKFPNFLFVPLDVSSKNKFFTFSPTEFFTPTFHYSSLVERLENACWLLRPACSLFLKIKCVRERRPTKSGIVNGGVGD